MNPSQIADQSGPGNSGHNADSHGPLARIEHLEFPLLLQIPKLGDDLQTTAYEINQLANAVRNLHKLSLVNNEVAEAQAREKRASENEAFAKERMTPNELEIYTKWKDHHFILPTIDWDTSRLAFPEPHSQHVMQYTRAMAIIWGYNDAVPENYAWICANLRHVVPLIRAVGKIVSANERVVDPPLPQLSASERVEYEAIKTIVKLTDANVKHERDRLRRLFDDIEKSQDILRGRLRELKK